MGHPKKRFGAAEAEALLRHSISPKKDSIRKLALRIGVSMEFFFSSKEFEIQLLLRKIRIKAYKKFITKLDYVHWGARVQYSLESSLNVNQFQNTKLR